jgi:hypothetical protein
MKNPQKDEPDSFNPAAGLKFGEKIHGFFVFFWHQVRIFSGCQTVDPLCTVDFRGEIPFGLPNPPVCQT